MSATTFEPTPAPNSTTTTTTTEAPNSTGEDLKFLIIPLVVIVIVMLLSALVYLMARKRRRDLIRENILSMYDFDTNEEWDSFNSYDHPSYNACDYNYTTAV